jgi:hypothetical protein
MIHLILSMYHLVPAGPPRPHSRCSVALGLLAPNYPGGRCRSSAARINAAAATWTVRRELLASPELSPRLNEIAVNFACVGKRLLALLRYRKQTHLSAVVLGFPPREACIWLNRASIPSQPLRGWPRSGPRH